MTGGDSYKIDMIDALTPLPVIRGGTARRIYAMILRYWFLLRGSWPRLLELAYWPTMQMLLWGFINQFMAQTSTWAALGAGVLVGAVLLWDVLFRGQLGVSVSFLEEMWSRNLAQLFVTPLRPMEWVAALTIISLLRTIVGVLPAALLAAPLFGYSVFDVGPALALFFANLLMMGWWLGLVVVALILRCGMGAEGLAWMLVFLLAPVGAAFYPVAALPGWLQAVALALPAAHVFEGMRAVLAGDGVPWAHMAWAALSNCVFFALSVGAFLWAFHDARRRGALMQTGE